MVGNSPRLPKVTPCPACVWACAEQSPDYKHSKDIWSPRLTFTSRHVTTLLTAGLQTTSCFSGDCVSAELTTQLPDSAVPPNPAAQKPSVPVASNWEHSHLCWRPECQKVARLTALPPASHREALHLSVKHLPVQLGVGIWANTNAPPWLCSSSVPLCAPSSLPNLLLCGTAFTSPEQNCSPPPFCEK